MRKKYISTWVTVGMSTYPAVAAYVSGSWGSEPGTDAAHVIVLAEVTQAEHDAILSAGFQEVPA